MTKEECPKCHKMTLRTVNVMGGTRRIHLACGNCCYKEKRDYNGKVVEQSPVIDADAEQKRQRAPYKYRQFMIKEVPSTEDLKRDVERINRKMRSIPNMPTVEEE